MSLRGKEHAFATPSKLGEKYAPFCALLGLAPTDTGYGLIMVEDENGEHWTCITDDIAYMEMLVEGNKSSVGLPEIPPDRFPIKRRGWPDEWRP